MNEETLTPDQFLQRISDYIRCHELLGGGGVVVGVSGGADSVALCWALRQAGDWPVEMAHVHHGLRGGADADADFVAALAQEWALPFHLERIDVPALAGQWGVGTEEAARRGRYQALSALAEKAQASTVAVGHHGDDQVETVLHRIARGTHLRGLTGMAPKRPLGDRLDLVRPLLWARRRQIEQFCRQQGLRWRTDHTNIDTDFDRNFIRHELLPMLRRRLNVRADEALLRLSSAAGEAQQVLEDLADRLFERACRKRSADEVLLRTVPLRKAPPLLASMALRRALTHLAAPEQQLNRQRFADLLELLRGKLSAVDLPGGVRVERSGQQLRLSRCPQSHCSGSND